MGARFAVTGPLMVDSAARHRLRADKVFVTSLGARASRDAAVLVEPGDRPYDAVFLGRFHPQKGIEDLIEIWRTVLRSRPQGRLAVAGDGSGSYSSAVKSALATLPPGSIELVGTVLGSEKETLLANGRILVFPSHYESAGQVVLEAMALGLPVVGYDIPSSRDLYEDAMLLVPPFDRECFARTTVDLLCDDHLYQLASRRSLALAAHHDWKIIARDLASSLRLS
jgi:glycosyltransferase involved in cell wall biosynthesis